MYNNMYVYGYLSMEFRVRDLFLTRAVGTES